MISFHICTCLHWVKYMTGTFRQNKVHHRVLFLSPVKFTLAAATMNENRGPGPFVDCPWPRIWHCLRCPSSSWMNVSLWTIGLFIYSCSFLIVIQTLIDFTGECYIDFLAFCASTQLFCSFKRGRKVYI